MKIVLLSFLLGAICSAGAWATVSAHATIDEIIRRGGRPFPPGSRERRLARMRGACVSFLSFVLLVAGASNAMAQAPVCHGARRPGQIAELLFGRDIGDRVGVSEAAWRRFVAREITPRFPDGVTVTNATGQWRDPASGKMVREPSKRVEIVLPGHADDDTRLDAVVAAYKRRFQQRSVGVIVQSACVSF